MKTLKDHIGRYHLAAKRNPNRKPTKMQEYALKNVVFLTSYGTLENQINQENEECRDDGKEDFEKLFEEPEDPASEKETIQLQEQPEILNPTKRIKTETYTSELSPLLATELPKNFVFRY